MKQIVYRLRKFLIVVVIGIILTFCLVYVPTENSAFAQSIQEAQKVRLQKLQIEAQKVFDLVMCIGNIHAIWIVYSAAV